VGRRTSLPLIVTVVVLIALALAIRFFGPAAWDALASLHGAPRH
jgi:hypothetical protein